jgi:hypothetical protein
MSILKRFGDFIFFWLRLFSGPIRFAKHVSRMPRFFRDLFVFHRLSREDRIGLLDLRPYLDDRGEVHEMDPQYFYVNAWAMRRILSAMPEQHVDVASLIVFSSLLSAVVPVVFVDYRLLPVRLEGLQCRQGNITSLPFADGSVSSLSCLHVAEHIGLGRYGDPLDPCGTEKACRDLARVLAPGGNLFLAVPVGRPRVCFNAHRVFRADTIVNYMKGLTLIEFSGVGDDGTYRENIPLDSFQRDEYALGMFWFRNKPG